MNYSSKGYAPISPRVLSSRFSLYPPNSMFCEERNSDHSIFEVKIFIAQKESRALQSSWAEH